MCSLWPGGASPRFYGSPGARCGLLLIRFECECHPAGQGYGNRGTDAQK